MIPYFVVVNCGSAQLRTLNGPVATFGNNVSAAVIQGQNIILTLNDGKTQIYQFSHTGKGVVGPIRTI
jgi:hypothetical protein